MGIEIERKFRVLNATWQSTARPGKHCVQAYLAFGPPASVRVRIMGGQATLNIKQSTLDIARAEYEYTIPHADAEELIAAHAAGRVVEKTRHEVDYAGQVWEVDVFAGQNAGLVLAEIELDAVTQHFARPAWLGEEVSGDPRYLNSSLAQCPWRSWADRA